MNAATLRAPRALDARWPDGTLQPAAVVAAAGELVDVELVEPTPAGWRALVRLPAEPRVCGVVDVRDLEPAGVPIPF